MERICLGRYHDQKVQIVTNAHFAEVDNSSCLTWLKAAYEYPLMLAHLADNSLDLGGKLD
jgi:hypothetical protein